MVSDDNMTLLCFILNFVAHQIILYYYYYCYFFWGWRWGAGLKAVDTIGNFTQNGYYHKTFLDYE